MNREELISYLSQPVGYDVAGNTIPDVQIVTGANDSGPGRNLNASDAGTNNVIMPLRSTIAPLHLKLGSQIVMVGQDGKTTRTVTVVGFYSVSAISLTLGGMVADNSVPIALANGHVLYAYSLSLDPKQSSSVLNKIQAAVPNAETLNLAQITVLINSILNNLIIMLTAIASLAMIAGVIIIANAVALAMLERRRELGILKAVGHTQPERAGRSAAGEWGHRVYRRRAGHGAGGAGSLHTGIARQVVELWSGDGTGTGHNLWHRDRLYGRGGCGCLECHPEYDRSRYCATSS